MLGLFIFVVLLFVYLFRDYFGKQKEKKQIKKYTQNLLDRTPLLPLDDESVRILDTYKKIDLGGKQFYMITGNSNHIDVKLWDVVDVNGKTGKPGFCYFSPQAAKNNADKLGLKMFSSKKEFEEYLDSFDVPRETVLYSILHDAGLMGVEKDYDTLLKEGFFNPIDALAIDESQKQIMKKQYKKLVDGNILWKNGYWSLPTGYWSPVNHKRMRQNIGRIGITVEEYQGHIFGIGYTDEFHYKSGLLVKPLYSQVLQPFLGYIEKDKL